ncbi:MAG TPA: hypothetical protein VFH83_00805, partial [Spirochaetia bacterium]|nr:hypothetical protein [Spirochaetia bacterium]
FTGDRRIGAFFLPVGAGWGGRSVFRELVQHPDGTLGTRWPQEMIPRTGDPVNLGFSALDSVASGDPSRIHLAAAGFTSAFLTGAPRNALIRFRVTAARGTYVFGVTVRAGQDPRKALSLEFEPSRRKVGWRSAADHAWKESEIAALYQVDGLEEPATVEVIIVDDLLDVCINGQRTLINYQVAGDGDGLLFYCHAGEVTFDSITVRPVLDSI